MKYFLGRSVTIEKKEQLPTLEELLKNQDQLFKPLSASPKTPSNTTFSEFYPNISESDLEDSYKAPHISKTTKSSPSEIPTEFAHLFNAETPTSAVTNALALFYLIAALQEASAGVPEAKAAELLQTEPLKNLVTEESRQALAKLAIRLQSQIKTQNLQALRDPKKNKAISFTNYPTLILNLIKSEKLQGALGCLEGVIGKIEEYKRMNKRSLVILVANFARGKIDFITKILPKLTFTDIESKKDSLLEAYNKAGESIKKWPLR